MLPLTAAGLLSADGPRRLARPLPSAALISMGIVAVLVPGRSQPPLVPMVVAHQEQNRCQHDEYPAGGQQQLTPEDGK